VCSSDLALGLASAVPGLIRWISGDDKSKAAQYAQTAVDVARQVTGKDDPAEAVAAIQANPELALKLQLAMMDHERAWWAEETKRLELDMRDRDSARDREIQTKDWTTRLLAVLIVLMASAATTAVLMGFVDGLKDPITAALVGGVINQIMNALAQVLNYYFGSSAGSARKDELRAVQAKK
jgi:hypothetical protein